MRWTQYFLNTLRETPADADAVSHQLMMRAGMIQKVAAGIYTYLPLGLRSIRKLEAIVREEMNREGAIELLMPSIAPAELWEESGRWQKYGKELLRVKDRHDRDFCYGPTHEEVVTDTVRKSVVSYRQLPLNLYQIQTKFRDEIRPRFGLMRGREFTMKDAYSFDVDDSGLEEQYTKMIRAYSAIFTRCKLEFTMVESDVGAIGGSSAHEFMVLAETGEDAVVKCSRGDYGANLEKASTGDLEPPEAGPAEPLEKKDTPGARTIEQISAFLGVSPSRTLKTLLFETDKEFVAAVVRGDLDVHEVKLRNHLGAEHLQLASESKVQQVTGGPVGFTGPVGLKGARVVVDRSVLKVVNAVAGANEPDRHFVHVNPGRDFDDSEIADIASARSGDPCPRCGGALEVARGIEVGNIFKLGTKYSLPMGCSFLDEGGVQKPMVMGCYGLGIGRTVAAAIEQNHDKDGVIWPRPLAHFEVLLIAVNPEDEAVKRTAEEIYTQLQEKGIEVLFDDRDERPGVKFKDADLIGIPVRVVVGAKSLADGKVEVSLRKDRERQHVEPGAAVERVLGLLR